GAPFFKEFTLELPKSPERVVKRLQKERILAGVPLKTFDRAYKNCLLVAVTEQRTRGEIDAYAAALAAATA
ncbi:MAG: glycine dehydrogenase, partial [candidate division NC10 bacterium]